MYQKGKNGFFINSIGDAATPRCLIMDCKQRLGERLARKAVSIIFSRGLAGKGIGGGGGGGGFGSTFFTSDKQ